MIMLPAVTVSKTALSPKAPVVDEVVLPPGKKFIEALPRSTSVIMIEPIASIEADA